MKSTGTLPRVKRGLANYADHVRAFSPNARLYLTSVIFTGAALGVYRLLFNFFVLSLGYNEALLGTLITTSSLTALISALPMGYLIDIIGQKRALIYGASCMVIAIGFMVLFPSAGMLVAMSVILGLGQSLNGVAMGPFLMENSGEKERTYLFSFSSGLTMASGFIGNWIGGYLPTWMASLHGVAPTSTLAYGWSVGIIAVSAAAGIVPLFFLRPTTLSHEQRSMFAPIKFFGNNKRLLGRLILPMLITSLGAGLIMPFLNVFYRQVHHQPDPVIGSMFAWGSLAMGVGLLIAPPIADRYGKIQVVVVTQALSIPFLFLMGFSPYYVLSAAAYYIRLALMNMSGPVYQTFVMERVDPSARATVASLVSMANNVGWAFSPQVSGWMQVNYGFDPAFASTIMLYIIAIYMYWRYFWYADRHKKMQPFTPEAI
ncbi:MAG: MFS transporter [Bellilinea sp.]